MKRLALKILLLSVGLLTLLVISFNGYPTVSKEDRTYIDNFMKDWGISVSPDSIHASFENELKFISQIQDSVVENIRPEQIAFDKVGNVQNYYQNRMGACYDRAILQEKIFLEYGFDIRHMYLYFNTNDKPIHTIDIFKKGLTSHAMLEVKTKRGWMTVGTNGNWLGLDENYNPLTIKKIRSLIKNNSFRPLKKTTMGVTFYEPLQNPSNFLIVYGLYSRHGQFLHSYPTENIQEWTGIRHFMPDYNLRMLLYNF